MLLALGETHLRAKMIQAGRTFGPLFVSESALVNQDRSVSEEFIAICMYIDDYINIHVSDSEICRQIVLQGPVPGPVQDCTRTGTGLI